MKLIKYTFALFVLGSAIVSCSKDDPEIIENEPEEKYMNITIDSPQNGTTFLQGETLTIQGQINSNFDAHGYIVRFRNTSNNDSLLSETDGHEHGDHISFSVAWTNNLSDTSDVRIEVIASSDHQGTYTEEEELTVTCLP
jgi:hypothetical protein